MNGLAVIEILKDSCSLEDGECKGTVKMHDVVRDVAIWIASSLEDECKSLVRSGIGLPKISESDLSGSLKRVSFMNNKIRKLPNWDMQCSEASTLLLQGNPQLEKVPELFLHAFQALKVLNVSGTRIQSLPPSLLNLFGLRALLLRNCCDLEELPPLGLLIRLRVLDLCATRIRELPKKMEKLTNLRQLDLSRTHYLRKFEAGIVSKWSSLEVLNMELSMYQWCTVGEGQATFEELKCLKRLVSLSIRLKRLPHLNSSYLRWISRLRKFQFFIGEAENSLPTIHDKRRVIISRLNVSGEWIAWFMINATSVVLNSCSGLKEMLQFLDTASALSSSERSLGALVGLKSLTITGSDCALSPRSSTHFPNHDLLPNLEELRLHGLSYLETISKLADHLGLLFSKLRLMEVVNCNQMKNILSYGNRIFTLRKRKVIKVSFCCMLENLFYYDSKNTSCVDPVVPNLQQLDLKNLPRLKSLCRPKESWPSLEWINVIECHLLRKLPLTNQNVSTIKVIRGDPLWWSQLTWDNEITASILEIYFKSDFPRATIILTPTPFFRC